MMRHHPGFRSPLCALLLVALLAEPVHALPPQFVATGLAALGWLSALVASAVSLALIALPRRTRYLTSATLALLVAIALLLVYWPQTARP